MLDAYIIDAIRREEEEREKAFERRRIHLEIPVYREPPPSHDREPEMDDESEEGGPIIIPLNPGNLEEDAA